MISRLNAKLPEILELDLKHLQGKGRGAASVELEAEVAIHFLGNRGLSSPVILDIGANIGLYTEAVLKITPNASVYAFEPSSAACKKLEERFTGNSQVIIIPLALGEQNKNATLWSDAAGSGLASLTKRRLDHFDINFSYSEEVEMTTLDEWIEESQVIPDLIKLDVEGHELNVLKGGLKAIALAKVIQFEFGGCNIDTRTFFQDFWYFFMDAGFNLYRISPKGPIRVSRYSEEDEYFSCTNYLAIKV
jgi:FkbM family methyltransferase